MNNTILSTLLFNQRLTKKQKAKVYDLFQYNVITFNEFLSKSDYLENNEKLEKQFPFDNEKFWDNVLENYKGDSPVVGSMLFDRLYGDFSFIGVDDSIWINVIFDYFDSLRLDFDFDGLGFMSTFNRWIDENKIIPDLDTSVWVGVIKQMHGNEYRYCGEILFYLCYNMFDDSEKQEINSYLDYEGEEYDEETDDYILSGETTDFKDYVDNIYGGLKQFIGSVS